MFPKQVTCEGSSPSFVFSHSTKPSLHQTFCLPNPHSTKPSLFQTLTLYQTLALPNHRSTKPSLYQTLALPNPRSTEPSLYQALTLYLNPRSTDPSYQSALFPFDLEILCSFCVQFIRLCPLILINSTIYAVGTLRF